MSKKEKLSKEEKKAKKAEKKANKNSDPAIKAVWFKCISAFVCTCIVCGSVSVCSGKYAEAIKKSPVAGGSTAIAENNDDVAPVSGDDVIATGDDTVASDDTAAPVDDAAVAGDDTQAAADTTGDTAADAQTPSAGEKTTAAAAKGNKALTTAEIVAKFNTAANKIKSGAKSIKQNYCENSQVSTPEINNAVIKSAADKLISANMGRDKTKENVTYSSAADKTAKFPISGQSYTSKLTADDVKSATISTSGNISTITIKVKDDPTPNTGTHAKKAYSVVTKEQIVEGAGSFGMKFIEEDSIGLSYANGVIKVKIDEKTGNIIAANYYIEWKLSLSTTVAGLNVAVAFGLEEDYTINW